MLSGLMYMAVGSTTGLFCRFSTCKYDGGTKRGPRIGTFFSKGSARVLLLLLLWTEVHSWMKLTYSTMCAFQISCDSNCVCACQWVFQDVTHLSTCMHSKVRGCLLWFHSRPTDVRHFSSNVFFPAPETVSLRMEIIVLGSKVDITKVNGFKIASHIYGISISPPTNQVSLCYKNTQIAILLSHSHPF